MSPKVGDYEMSKQDVNIQDTVDDIKTILNRGQYELTVISSSSPNWTESINGIMVLGIFAGTATLWISNMNATNKWSGVDLTDLP